MAHTKYLYFLQNKILKLSVNFHFVTYTDLNPFVVETVPVNAHLLLIKDALS